MGTGGPFLGGKASSHEPDHRHLVTTLECLSPPSSPFMFRIVGTLEQEEMCILMLAASRVAGEVVGRPAWGKDQPNNYNGEQNCVVLDGGRNWLWNDVGCNLDYLHWICQHSKCPALFGNASG